MKTRCQVLVVGAGIAGVAAASRLVDFNCDVTLIDGEGRVAHHASGRSAALGDSIYTPNEDVAALTRAGEEMLRSIPGAMTPKGSLHLYGEDDRELWSEAHQACVENGVKVEALLRDQLAARFPYVRANKDRADTALYLAPGDANAFDVNAIFAYFGRRFSAMGGKTLLGERLLSGSYGGGYWTIRTTSQTIMADIVINASGAWCDDVAIRCGVEPADVAPLKRTVIETDHNGHPALYRRPGPFIFWDGQTEDLYCDFREDGRVLISPADEQPSVPCDAQATTHDTTQAMGRFQDRTKIELATTGRRYWAGLRTFAKDRRPIIGWDRDVPGFYWSAAYGGFGLECCLSASALVEIDITGRAPDDSILSKHGVKATRFLVDRFSPAKKVLS